MLLLKHTVPWPHLATREVQYVLQSSAQEEKMDFREHLSVSATTTLLMSHFPLVFSSAVKNSKFLGKQIFISAYMPGTALDPPGIPIATNAVWFPEVYHASRTLY